MGKGGSFSGNRVPMLDIRAVAQVPISAPIRMGIAASIGISP